jgi:hypothetical protein
MSQENVGAVQRVYGGISAPGLGDVPGAGADQVGAHAKSDRPQRFLTLLGSGRGQTFLQIAKTCIFSLWPVLSLLAAPNQPWRSGEL